MEDGRRSSGGLAWVAIGAALFWAGFARPTLQWDEAADWAIIPGRVAASGVAYEFRFGDRTFTGRHPRPLPAGAEVEVRFDVDDPTRSLIAPAPPGPAALAATCGLFFLGSGAWTLVARR